MANLDHKLWAETRLTFSIPYFCTLRNHAIEPEEQQQLFYNINITHQVESSSVWLH